MLHRRALTFVSRVLDDLIHQFLLVVGAFHLTGTQQVETELRTAAKACGAAGGFTWCSARPSFCTADRSCSSAGPADPATGNTCLSRSVATVSGDAGEAGLTSDSSLLMAMALC